LIVSLINDANILKIYKYFFTKNITSARIWIGNLLPIYERLYQLLRHVIIFIAITGEIISVYDFISSLTINRRAI